MTPALVPVYTSAMDVQALATTPIFLSSLVICALVAAYAIALIFFSVFRSLSKAAATAGFRPYELEAVEHAGIFHNLLEDFIDKLVTLEELSTEVPEPFNDHSWTRILELSDNLESVRNDLHSLLQSRDFEQAYSLGRFLSGGTSGVPNIPRAKNAVELRLISGWRFHANELLQRMIAKIEDSLAYGISGTNTPPSPQFMRTLEQLKAEIIEQGDRRQV